MKGSLPTRALSRVAGLQVSAASGLVALPGSPGSPGKLCVVADDEHALDVYGLDGALLSRVALWPTPLPESAKERKRQKADLESLCLLPDGRLLALGSGSTPARRRGALVELARGTVREIDLGPLWAALGLEVDDLNIEGATVYAGRLWLLQRGNGPHRDNACVELALSAVLADLDRTASMTVGGLLAVHHVALGELDGVALSFTDLTADEQRGLCFSAAAEDTKSTYDDGACVGSVIGLMSERGELQRVERLAPAHKIEGIAYAQGGARDTLWLVADADDRTVPASLFRTDVLPA